MPLRFSLQGKLLLTFLGSVALALGVTVLTIVGLAGWLISLENGDPWGSLKMVPAVQAQAQAVSRVLAGGAAAEPAAVREAALGVGLPPGARVTVVALDGTIWLDTDAAGQTGGIIAPAEVLGWLPGGGAAGLGGLLTEPLRVDGLLWGYYVYQPPHWDRQSPAPTDRSLQAVSGGVMLAGQLFVLLVSLLLFWTFGRHLIRPVRRLSEVVGRIAEGDLTVRAGLDQRHDELGQLARHVDSMAERLQEARARASEAEAARRYTVAAISHDLRTPLTALMAHAEAVRTGVTEDADRSLAVIQEKAQHMQGLIDDLFELAALDADRSSWQTRRQDVAEIVRESVVGLLPQFEAAGMNLEPEIPDEPVPADLPPGKLERVLDNLLTNALRYGAAGRWLRVALRQQEGSVRIEVADHGPGIPPGEERRIFDRFYRVENSRSGTSRGTGLGLAVAARIVEHLGGRIGVESPPGGGACFWVEVPVAERKRSAS
ncbi:MAG TPA: HAMP domain-containing sensor histidine kinase [Symbiobacteriaceae bacterium]|nr:HAMP domain-containing sensor histidine kinase [Symbiobacteriaceae bacterium]